MKPVARVAPLLAALLVLACGSRGKDDPILSLSAAESLAEGKRLMADERWSQARPYLSHAFEVEPNSAAGREALLMVADSLFLEGGEANLIQAEAKYRDFQNRFPTSDKAPYVQFQIAQLARPAHRAAGPRPGVDREGAHQALRGPAAPLPDQRVRREGAGRDRPRCADHLAEHEYLVGRFYLRYGLPVAASLRLEALLAKYPDYTERDKALLHLGLAYQAAKRDDDAQATFSKLKSEFPESRWVEKIPKEKG